MSATSLEVSWTGNLNLVAKQQLNLEAKAHNWRHFPLPNNMVLIRDLGL